MEMQTLKRIRGLTATIIVTALLFIFTFSLAGVDGRQVKGNTEGCCRPDVLIIDSVKIFGDLERQPVLFLHDKHTVALEKKDKNCRTCHLSEKDRLSPKFKRFKDAGRQEVMDIYHSGCMACHKEMYAEKDKLRIRRMDGKRKTEFWFELSSEVLGMSDLQLFKDFWNTAGR